MSLKLNSEIAVIGIDIGKNSFHLVGQHRRGSIVLRQKWSRGQVEARLANLQPCLFLGRCEIAARQCGVSTDIGPGAIGWGRIFCRQALQPTDTFSAFIDSALVEAEPRTLQHRSGG